ncbi:MAG: hypothetical protein ABR903_04160 [Thermodesulfovibrionales bacterium]|jgi:hypothetical protein
MRREKLAVRDVELPLSMFVMLGARARDFVDAGQLQLRFERYYCYSSHESIFERQ